MSTRSPMDVSKPYQEYADLIAQDKEKTEATSYDNYRKLIAPAAPKDEVAADVPSRTPMDFAKDTMVDLRKGAVGLVDSTVGLANMATGNLVGKGLDSAFDYGDRVEAAQARLNAMYSPARAAANKRVEEAEGFLGNIKALAENPSAAFGMMMESAPGTLSIAGGVKMLAGRMLAKEGIKKGTKEAAEFFARPEVMAKLTAVSSAIEGAQSAGSTQEQARREGRDWSQSVLPAIMAGASTAAIGFLSSKIIPDVETKLATATLGGGVTGQGKRELIEAGKAIAKDIFKEGALEELPQSASEQVFSNLALGKPWKEGVAEAAASGLVVGGMMGGGMSTSSEILNRAGEKKAEGPESRRLRVWTEKAAVLDQKIDAGTATDQERQEFEVLRNNIVSQVTILGTKELDKEEANGGVARKPMTPEGDTPKSILLGEKKITPKDVLTGNDEIDVKSEEDLTDDILKKIDEKVAEGNAPKAEAEEKPENIIDLNAPGSGVAEPGASPVFEDKITPYGISKKWDDLYSKAQDVEDKNKSAIAELQKEKAEIPKGDRSGRKTEIDKQIKALNTEVDVAHEAAEIDFQAATDEYAKKIIERVNQEGIAAEEDDIREAISSLSEARMHDHGGPDTWDAPLDDQVIEYLKREQPGDIKAVGTGGKRVPIETPVDAPKPPKDSISGKVESNTPVAPLSQTDAATVGNADDAKIGGSSQKEPWQMTKAEYKKFVEKEWAAGRGMTKEGVAIQPGVKITDGYHQGQIMKAIAEGKPVSPEVLKEYPFLKADLPGAKTVTAPSEKAGTAAPLRPEAKDEISSSPTAPLGEGWESDRGAIPGEPSQTYKGKAAIIERVNDQGMVLYEAATDQGDSLGVFENITEAQKAAEQHVDKTPSPDSSVSPDLQGTAKVQGTKKEPWQMTWREYVKDQKTTLGKMTEAQIAHADIVEKAIAEGKPVSPEVIKDVADAKAQRQKREDILSGQPKEIKAVGTGGKRGPTNKVEEPKTEEPAMPDRIKDGIIPFTPDLPSKPKPTELGIQKKDPKMMRVLVEGKKAWSNGHFIEVTDDALYPRMEQGIVKKEPFSADKIWNPVADHLIKVDATPLLLLNNNPYGLEANKAGVQYTYVFDRGNGDDIALVISKVLYDHFYKRYKNLSFRIAGYGEETSERPVAVYSGDKMVGVVMPIKWNRDFKTSSFKSALKAKQGTDEKEEPKKIKAVGTGGKRASSSKTEEPKAPEEQKEKEPGFAAKWDAMDYSERQAIVQASTYASHRAVVHRLSSSKWDKISSGEREDIVKAAEKLAGASKESPKGEGYVPHDEWENNLIKAKEYATALGIPLETKAEKGFPSISKTLEHLVREIKETEHYNKLAGVGEPKADIESEIENISDDELDAILDENKKGEVEQKAGAPGASGKTDRTKKAVEQKDKAPKAPKAEKPAKTLDQIIESAAKHGVTGIDEAMKGLYDLFGGGALKSFPGGIDEETYAKAKPHFVAALDNFIKVGKGLKEFAAYIVDELTEKIIPYIKQFVKEKREELRAARESKKKAAEEKKAKKEAMGDFQNVGYVYDPEHLRKKIGDKPPKTAAQIILDEMLPSKLWAVNHPNDVTPGTLRLHHGMQQYFKSFKDYLFSSYDRLYPHKYRSDSAMDTITRWLERGGNIEDLKKWAAEYGAAIQPYVEAFRGANNITSVVGRLQDTILSSVEKVGGQFPETYPANIQSPYFQSRELANGPPRFLYHFLTRGWQSHLDAESDTMFDDIDINRRGRNKIVVRNNMPDYRAGLEIKNSEGFQKPFGFKGVGYGEQSWIDQAERARVINAAYDAFQDLASTIGAPANGMSLGGELSIQFGNLGHLVKMRGAAAAFFSKINTINMTRDNGDGCLSHEWGHAIHYMASPEAKGEINALIESFRHIYDFDAGVRLVDDLLAKDSPFLRRILSSKKQNRIEAVRKEVERQYDETVKKDTDYLTACNKIKGDYTARETEMWARAFEAYVYDTMGGENNYLVTDFVSDGLLSGRLGLNTLLVYPSGKEREDFNESMKQFFDGIQWDEKGLPSLKDDYESVAQRNSRLVKENLEKLLATVEERYNAIWASEPSADGYYWYSYEETSFGPMMQPDGYVGYDKAYKGDAQNGTGAVCYLTQLHPDAIMDYKVKNFIYDGESPTYIKQKEGGISDGIREDGERPLDEESPDNDRPTEEGGDIREGSEDGGGEGSPGGRQAGTERDASGSGEGDDTAGVHTPTPGNYRITDPTLTDPKSIEIRFRKNLAAIKLLKQLELEGRAASPGTISIGEPPPGGWTDADKVPGSRGPQVNEKEILAGYTGWGGLSELFAYTPGKAWAGRAELIKAELTDEEMRAAASSGPSSYYTPVPVAQYMWKLAQRLGLDRGQVIDPATGGNGLFIGTRPNELDQSITFQGIEMDSISARIAAKLYELANIENKSFQDAKKPINRYDLAITNVPFEGYAPTDLKHNKGKHSLHNYYINKMIDLTAPGALTMVITSSTTMDSGGAHLAEYAKKAELVGAIRLPSGIYSATNVVTDILVFRKNIANSKYQGVPVEEWTATGQDESTGLTINKYFLNHPEMVAGKLEVIAGRYGDERLRVAPEGDLQDHLARIARAFPSDIVEREVMAELQNIDDIIAAPGTVSEGRYYINDDGAVCQRIDGAEVKLPTTTPKEKKEAAIVKGFVGILDNVLGTLRAQKTNESDEVVAEKQKRLLKSYKDFVKKHGPVNALENLKIYIDSTDAPWVVALEDYDPDEKKVTKLADIFTKNIVGAAHKPERAETDHDALAMSLNEFGFPNLNYMAKLRGTDVDTILAGVADRIIEDPETGLMVTMDEYLSGNVRQKLIVARSMAASNPEYDHNVKLLEASMPQDIPADRITARIGASWVKPEHLSDYVRDKLNLNDNALRAIFSFNPVTNEWSMSYRGRETWKGENKAETRRKIDVAKDSVEATKQWGTDRMDFLEIMNHIIQGVHSPQVTYKVDRKTYVDIAGTEAVAAKIVDIQNDFGRWLFTDGERADEAVSRFNNLINTSVPPKADGSHLTFPGKSMAMLTPKERDALGVGNAIAFYPHQMNAVWKYLRGGNLYLAHEVGAGKTATMALLAMEAKRLLGKKKIIYVTLNDSTMGQAVSEIKRLYPLANILPVRVSTNEERKRLTLQKVALNSFDVCIMRQQDLDRIALSPESERVFIREEIDELREILEEIKGKGGRIQEQQIQQQLHDLEEKLKAPSVHADAKSKNLFFDDLGIDLMIVDEAHQYKNVPYATRLTRITGLNPAGSPTSKAFFRKTQYLNANLPKHDGIVLASGTALSNSLAEMYNIQRMLQPQEVKRQGVWSFDRWVASFADIGQQSEWDGALSEYKVVTTVRKIVNAGRMLATSYQNVDSVRAKDTPIKRPTIRGGEPIRVKITPNQYVEHYKKVIIDRCRALVLSPRHATHEGRPDNMLRIISDMSLVAIDQRLLTSKEETGELDAKGRKKYRTIPGPYANTELQQDSKIFHAANNIHKRWEEEAKRKGVQLVFADLGIPKRFAEDLYYENGKKFKVLTDDKIAELSDRMQAEYAELLAQHEWTAEGAFNTYDGLKNELVKRGIPASQIAFIHDADHTNKDKKAANLRRLFKRVNAGEIRVLIGSTSKAGTGVNIQERVSDVHHLDVWWNYSAWEQRNGRAIRAGNMYTDLEGVYIHNYVTETTVDATRWSKIFAKGKVLNATLGGDINIDIIEDISEETISAKLMEADASGNPLMAIQAVLMQEVQRLRYEQSAHLENVRTSRMELAGIPGRITTLEKHIADYQKSREVMKNVTAVRFAGDDRTLVFEKHGKEIAEALQKAVAAKAAKAWMPNDTETLLVLGSHKETSKEVTDENGKKKTVKEYTFTPVTAKADIVGVAGDPYGRTLLLTGNILSSERRLANIFMKKDGKTVDKVDILANISRTVTEYSSRLDAWEKEANEQIDNLKGREPKLKKIADEPWAKLDLFNQKSQEYAEVERKLEEQGRSSGNPKDGVTIDQYKGVVPIIEDLARPAAWYKDRGIIYPMPDHGDPKIGILDDDIDLKDFSKGRKNIKPDSRYDVPANLRVLKDSDYRLDDKNYKPVAYTTINDDTHFWMGPETDGKGFLKVDPSAWGLLERIVGKDGEWWHYGHEGSSYLVHINKAGNRDAFIKAIRDTDPPKGVKEIITKQAQDAMFNQVQHNAPAVASAAVNESTGPHEHYTTRGPDHFKVTGEDVVVAPWPWLETFVHYKQEGRAWEVVEKFTGMALTSSIESKEIAIKKAKELLPARGEAGVKRYILKALEERGGTPYYKSWANYSAKPKAEVIFQRRGKETPDIRYSLKKRNADARYLELAKDPEKNKAELQKMVDEAAKAAGYNKNAYRGAEQDYVKWDDYEFKKADQTYFTAQKEYAESYGGHLYNVYLKSSNPFIPAEINEATDWEYLSRIKELQAAGHDSVIGIDKNGQEEVLVVFSPTQIKSADPITRDDQGNIIPLSERFNQNSPDIRYSLKKRKAQTNTPEFKAWFKNSKVVDENGEPLVVYKAMHPYDWTKETKDYSGPEITSINRRTEFPAFNHGEKGIKITGFFGSQEVANRFAEGAGQGQSIYPAYLSFKNPYIINASGKNAADVQFGETGRPFRDAVRSGKYDSVIIKDTKDEATIYVALNPTQIKSAIGNVGTFDENNADIRYKRTRRTSGLQSSEAKATINKVVSAIPNPPKVNVVQSNEDCPAEVRAIMAEDGIDDAMGFTYKGEVYLVSDNLKNTEEALKTLAHELTHSGLGMFFQRQGAKSSGKLMTVRAKYEALMDAIYKAHSAEIEKLAKDTHTHFNMRTDKDRRMACEEWLCNQTYAAQYKWYDQLVTIFNDLLRAVGINVRLSNAEVRVILQDAFKEFGGEGIHFKIAHHGTPNAWAPEPGFPHGRPRLDKIGTGEGGAAFGWGWYSSDTEGVATSYRQNGKEEKHIKVGNRRIGLYLREEKTDAERDAALELLDSNGDFERAKKRIGNAYAKSSPILKALEALEREGATINKGDGTLFKLDIPDDVMDKLLDFDRPLSQQSAYVKKKLTPIVRELHIDSKTGESIYEHLMRVNGESDREASLYLASIGIPGNRYMDSFSRPFMGVTPKTHTIGKMAGQNGYYFFDKKTDYLDTDIPAIATKEEAEAWLRGDKRSYNYVIWDQPTLDRIALLERNGEKLDAIREVQDEREAVNFQRREGAVNNLDARYLELAKDPEKNKAELQKMVNEAAKAAGSVTPRVYHVGSFNKTKDRVFKPGSYKGLTFFSELKSDAEERAADYGASGGNNITEAYLFGNIFDVDNSKHIKQLKDYAEKNGYDIEELENGNYSTWESGEIIPYVKSIGFGGITTYEGDGKNWAVFSPNQIKSADLITKDDSGNIIPLSERFNATNPDIRFQRAGTQAGAVTADGDMSLFPEVNERLKAAKGVKYASLKDRAKDTLVAGWEHFTRHFQHLDPKADGALIDVLRRFQDVPAWAKNETTQKLSSFMANLTPEDRNVFSMNILLPDMLRDIESGLLSTEDEGGLPFGYTDAEQVQRDYDHFQAQAERNPDIKQALRLRNKFMGVLTDQLIENKLLKKDAAKDPSAYFHHQVLAYANYKDNPNWGMASKDVRAHRKGWQIGRKGSALDYNTEFVEAEFEVISQALTQIETVKALNEVQRMADIKANLVAEARAANMATFHEKQQNAFPGTDTLKPFKVKIAMGMSKIAKLATKDELYVPEYLDDVIEHIIDQEEQRKAAKADEMEFYPESHPKMFQLLNYLINHQGEGSMPAAMIFKAIAERNKYIKDTCGKDFVTYRDLVPDGYVIHKPDATSTFYFANTITDQAIDQVMAGNKALPDAVRQVLARGKDHEWVVKEGLSKTLNEFRPKQDDSLPAKISMDLMSTWKQWILMNPFRVLKYNINNMSGDLDIAMAYDPKIITGHLLTAFKDLWAMHKGKANDRLSDEISSLIKMGVVGSGMTQIDIPELGDVKSIKELVDYFDGSLKNALSRWYSMNKKMSTLRENALRLASYRYFIERLDRGDQNVYGASRRTEINSVRNNLSNKEVAAKLARELIGDYGNISHAGQYIRQRLIPFYSWIEINAPRYVRLFQNLKHEGGNGGYASLSGALAWKATKLGAKACALMAMVVLWNAAFFPDEEDELQESGREQLHLILGRRDDGTIITLRFQGALSDALGWFGFQNPAETLKRMVSGTMGGGDLATQVATAAPKKLFQGLRPEPKMLYEVASGQTFFPDPLNPRPIRDTVEHVARTFSMDKIYKLAAGKPKQDGSTGSQLMRDVSNMVIAESDPGEQAYYTARKYVYDWLDDNGKERGRSIPTNRSNALYYYKQALRYSDFDAAARYLKKYQELGGKLTDVGASVRRAHPLSSMSLADRYQFKTSLSPEQRKTLDTALVWYKKHYMENYVEQIKKPAA